MLLRRWFLICRAVVGLILLTVAALCTSLWIILLAGLSTCSLFLLYLGGLAKRELRPWLKSIALQSINLFTVAHRWIFDCVSGVEWDIQGEGVLRRQGWSFVCSNHRSWVDILVLQRVFHRKLPVLRFFMKRELLWLFPIGGIACRWLGFPFLSRRGRLSVTKDREAIYKACLESRGIPGVWACFVEGTRYTQAKSTQQGGQYQHLLRPKSGGFVLTQQALGENLQAMVDVTIVYVGDTPSLWNVLCGRVRKIIVRYEVVIPIGAYFRGSSAPDRAARRETTRWLEARWQQKDRLITTLLEKEKSG